MFKNEQVGHKYFSSLKKNWNLILNKPNKIKVEFLQHKQTNKCPQKLQKHQEIEFMHKRN